MEGVHHRLPLKNEIFRPLRLIVVFDQNDASRTDWLKHLRQQRSTSTSKRRGERPLVSFRRDHSDREYHPEKRGMRRFSGDRSGIADRAFEQ